MIKDLHRPSVRFMFLGFTLLIASSCFLPQPPQSGFYTRIVQDVSWPKLGTCKRSLAEIANGYRSGYVRTAYGYLIFSLLTLAFLGLGRVFMTYVIEKFFHRMKTQTSMSRVEMWVLYYMFGACCWAMVWLVLGLTRSATESRAVIMLFIGALLFAFQIKNFRSDMKEIWKENVLQSFKTLGRACAFYEQALKIDPNASVPKQALLEIYSFFGKPYK